jgi:RNA polymerase primary sigma factor
MDSDREVLNAYIQEIRRWPLLTPEEELACARRIRQGDEEAFQHLVRSNLRFVVNMVKRYRRAGVSLLDLINEGNVGLCRAARRFDPEIGLRFVSYAVWWIRATLSIFLARQGGLISIPVKKVSLVYQLDSIHQELFNRLHRTPTPEELAAEIAVAVNEVAQISQALRGFVSLDRYLHMEDMLQHKDAVAGQNMQPVERHLTLLTMREHLSTCLSRLKERERLSLELYFGLNGVPASETYADLGRRLEISREGARNLFHRSIEKLRRIVREEDPDRELEQLA